MPLAIIKPEMEVTLIDSAGKKIRFIRHVGRTLKLGNIHPLHQRVEDLDEAGTLQISPPGHLLHSRSLSKRSGPVQINPHACWQ